VRAGLWTSFRGKGAVQNFFADAYGLSGSERGNKRSRSSCEGMLQRQREMQDQLFCAKLLICEASNNCSNNARR
jgi:hypothetical protein